MGFMWEWINWGEVETAELNPYEFIYILLIMFILIFSALSISTTNQAHQLVTSV